MRELGDYKLWLQKAQQELDELEDEVAWTRDRGRGRYEMGRHCGGGWMMEGRH